MFQPSLLDPAAGRQYVLVVPVRTDTVGTYFDVWTGSGWSTDWADAQLYDSQRDGEIAQRDAIQASGPLVAVMLRHGKVVEAPPVSSRSGSVRIRHPKPPRKHTDRRALHNILREPQK